MGFSHLNNLFGIFRKQDNKLLTFLLFVIPLSFAGGFYFSTLLQGQNQVLSIVAIIIAFLTWLGSGADFIGLFREWMKDKEDKRNTGKLEYDAKIEITVGDTSMYYLRIRNVTQGTTIINCKSSLYMQGYNLIHLLWRSNNISNVNVKSRDEILLFLVKIVQNEKYIIFDYSKRETKRYKRYFEFENKEIVIEFVCEKGFLPTEYYRKTVKKIIDNAIEEKSLQTYIFKITNLL